MWFNANCSKGKNHLAAYAPGEHFEDNGEYVDIAIRNAKDHEDPIVVQRSALINFLKEVYSAIPIASGKSTIYMSCSCEEQKCTKKLIFSYHDKRLVKFHIENSTQPEAIILTKEEVKEFCEKFEN